MTTATTPAQIAATAQLRSLEQILIVEDGSHYLWRIFPGGAAQYVENTEPAHVAALTPHANLRVEHLQNREPFEVLRFQICPECEGKGYVDDVLVIYDHHGADDNDGTFGSTVVGRFLGASLDDLSGLGPNQSIGRNAWDCEHDGCNHGIVLEATGTYLERSELAQQVAA